jgi:phage head maturation protease
MFPIDELFECAAGREAGRAYRGVVMVPDSVARPMRDHLACAGCGLRIAPSADRVIRGAQVFHPSHDPLLRRATTAPPPAPRVLGVLGGVAVRFDKAGCGFRTAAGDEHERFTPDCFDESIARGGQTLQVNHGDVALRGAFLTIGNDGGQLQFRFRLLDGPLERRTFGQVQRGEVNGCSIRFKSHQMRYDYRTVEHQQADLVEISLLTDSRRPAWYGTHVSVVD